MVSNFTTFGEIDLGDTSAGEFDPSSVGGLLLLLGIKNNINPDQTAHIPGTCVSLYRYLLHYLLQKPERPGRIAQSVTSLATDASLTADPGVDPGPVLYFRGD